MKLEKFKNFMWGIAFGVSLSGFFRTEDETVVIPMTIMLLIGIVFFINFIKE